MNLEEFRIHVEETRKASMVQALSVLSATISTTTTKGDN